VRDERDPAGRHEHEPDREPADRPHVALELARVGEEGGAVEQRRQEQQEHEVRVERDLADPGHEPEREPARDEGDRVGHADDPREDRQRDDRHEQAEDRELEMVLHGARAG
jgi:hypothetical protein